ncbi:MAG: hypothetical protein QNJ44_03430 [Rhodobacter sp.]|nr:hypothetical protein [Rhodobacter sp.]
MRASRFFLVFGLALGLASVSPAADLAELIGAARSGQDSFSEVREIFSTGDGDLQKSLLKTIITSGDEDLIALSLPYALISRDPGVRSLALWRMVSSSGALSFLLTAPQDQDKEPLAWGFTMHRVDHQRRSIEILEEFPNYPLQGRDDKLSVIGDTINFTIKDIEYDVDGTLSLTPGTGRLAGKVRFSGTFKKTLDYSASLTLLND